MEVNITVCQDTRQEQYLPSAVFDDDGLEWKEIQRGLIGQQRSGTVLPSILKGSDESDESYATGLEFICERRDEQNIGIGYKMSWNQMLVDVKSLRGFDLAIGGKCIRAIRPITAGPASASSKWSGNPEYTSRISRLVYDEDIPALAVELDSLNPADVKGYRLWAKSAKENSSKLKDERQFHGRLNRPLNA
ncbi:hypothetical protein MPDQ_004527 [Monascus purpureus]|uniref:DUF7600 domain-containing protein n=1 Tax=Monascus purpureus TaxID=5098 RepID=A0A507QL49_MONPU|nr:hypothetical protein MPDQ_004527 [Monascus purpureus]